MRTTIMLTLLKACDYTYEDLEGNYQKISAKDIFLTKTIISKNHKKQANNPPIFELGESYSPITLEETFQILQQLEKDPHTLVIRFEYTDNEVGDIVRRLGKLVRLKPSKIVALDIDGIPLPQGIGITDINAQAKYVLSLLNQVNPDFFPLDTGFIAQASSSAGMSKHIKLHLWFENKSEVNQNQLKNCFGILNTEYKKLFKSSVSLVDLALYNTVQPHYTAAPIFIDQSLNPFLGGSRTSLVKGSTCFIPANFPEYVKPAEVTSGEVSSFLSSIKGSSILDEKVEAALQVVKSWNPKVKGVRNKVIALYHTAIQQQFSLEILDREVLRILRGIRPGEEAEYIRQGKNAAIAHIKACSLRTVPAFVKGINIRLIDTEDTDRFLKLKKSLPSNGLVFLKATLGTGKTHLISEMLKAGEIKGKFLAITDTSALVESNAARFEALDFRSPDSVHKLLTGETNRLSGTLHSLHKLEKCSHMFDFVFIDEADSVMNNLLFAPIIDDTNRMKILDVLGTLLRTSNIVILSDGDLSEQTITAYMDLVHGNRDMYRINHIRQNLKGVTAYKHLNEASLWGRLSNQLYQGKKCLLVSDSSPGSLNTYLNALKRIHPTKNIQVIHASSKSDTITADIINNTTEALNRLKVDAVLCSPSVTNGVDFNYFDTVFVSTKTDNHTPNMRYQAMMRERQPKEIHYYIYNMPKFKTGYEEVVVDTGWLSKTRALYSARREAEYKTYKATFAYYLVSAGAKIRCIDENMDNPRTEADKQDYLIERTNAIVAASEFVLIPRHNDAYEIQKLIKELYQLEEVDYSTAFMFIKDKINEKLKMLHILADEYWDVLKLNDPAALQKVLNKTGHKFYLLTGKSLTTNPAPKILEDCGISPDNFDINKLTELYKRYCNYNRLKESPKIVPPTNNISELAQL